MEELLRSHTPRPVWYSRPHPHASPSHGPPPCQPCVPSLAENLPPVPSTMVSVISYDGRGLLEDFSRTRERVSADSNLQLHGSSWCHSTTFLPHQTNHNHWADIQRFSETLAGPLPLLHTITIDLHQDPGDPEAMISPSAHLFSGAVNLKEFLFRSKIPSSLNHFVFPNLTMFEFWAGNEGFYASQLLDFLDASPMLRTVTLVFADSILPENIPQERVVVLPNVEIIFMLVNEGGAGYRIAAHMSCPSTRLTSFLHWRAFGDAPPEEIFPNPVPWDAIARQYSGSPP